jgi:NAD(P)-dependent dehydrogenase (short-subunit alcohol dehydrogenase family)
MRLDNAVAVVTGAASGIGLAIVRAMLATGATVVMADRDETMLAQAKQALAHPRCHAMVADVTDEQSIKALAESTRAAHGHVDVLVNNAGVGLGGPFERIPIAEWRWIIDVNLLGVVRGMQAFLPAMIERGSGWIVNVASSVALFPGTPNAAPYVATKCAVAGLSHSLRAYLAPKGIGVTLLCPDNTETAFRQTAKVVGADRASVVASLPPTPSQLPAAVAEALMTGLREGRFLVSLTPNVEARLEREIDSLFGLKALDGAARL